MYALTSGGALVAAMVRISSMYGESTYLMLPLSSCLLSTNTTNTYIPHTQYTILYRWHACISCIYHYIVYQHGMYVCTLPSLCIRSTCIMLRGTTLYGYHVYALYTKSMGCMQYIEYMVSCIYTMIHGGLSIHPRILPYYCIRVWGLYMYVYSMYGVCTGVQHVYTYHDMLISLPASQKAPLGISPICACVEGMYAMQYHTIMQQIRNTITT